MVKSLCVLQTSALQAKKNYQGGLNDTPNVAVMWLISSSYSSPYPGKTDLQTTSSLPTSDMKMEGEGKEIQHQQQENEEHGTDWAVVSGKLEATR